MDRHIDIDVVVDMDIVSYASSWVAEKELGFVTIVLLPLYLLYIHIMAI